MNSPAVSGHARCRWARFVLCFVLLPLASARFADTRADAPVFPLGTPGDVAAYRWSEPQPPRASDVAWFRLSLGPIESSDSPPAQWVALEATKANGETFTLWLLTQDLVSGDLDHDERVTRRYLLQEAQRAPREFLDRDRGGAVLPSTGAWPYLWPTTDSSSGVLSHGIRNAETRLLGARYRLDPATSGAFPAVPTDSLRIALRPHLRIGLPSNARTHETARRFDGSDYPMVRMERADYEQLLEAGVTVVRVDRQQAAWVENASVYHWGPSVAELPFPESLYRSHYLGPALFLDEPAVGTRDHDVRPRFVKDPALRHDWTPERMFEAFQHHYHQAVVEGPPSVLLKALRQRPDVTMSGMSFLQANLYSWETMVSTALWQLAGEPAYHPRAIMFEPPGRLGTRRTIPEMNMTYGCQLPPAHPLSLTEQVFGFLRGAARAADRDWGVSIYGAVDPADAPVLLTRAYDLGATDFSFWDNYQLACVPFSECLALTRHLVAHAARHPERDLVRLRGAADTLILLPAGYDLGHVQMGRGNLWGLGELNLERRNPTGTRYREVMASFFIEIERCLRLGISFDAAWDLPGRQFPGYREIVRVRPDARLDLTTVSRTVSRRSPRIPARPPGVPPRLDLDLDSRQDSGGGDQGSLGAFTARARIHEGSSSVYYTTGSDAQGVHPNARVLWELYGPRDEDYRTLLNPGAHPRTQAQPGGWIVSVDFQVSEPGRYRLRAATTDPEGRSAVTWKEWTWKP